MNMNMGWVAFWGFAGRLAICATVVWIGADALETARVIWGG